MKIYEFIKRIFDILAAVVGLIITSPVWLIATIGIFISDPGAIFYVAHRVGKNNRVFKMLKFRSMRKGKANESVFRGEEDRIFPFGKFIRATKIDELPQLLCCIVGTMSIVGPRPAAKDQTAITRAGKYAAVSEVKPGLSGPAALYDYLFGDTITDEKEYETRVLPTRLNLELYYVKYRSVGLDIKIIYYTIVCILASFIKKRPEKILSWLCKTASVMQDN